ncbi:M23 family metallopeptidase [Aestuariivita boseongensis]|uniref:M23 family metallopeptidase n=1 Tax=Aestuariivita boseongensis TaxID=1470562 RepID=UPI0006813F8C|nr:M23 family metallopeptidase [Aestuariivita boseongensis]
MRAALAATFLSLAGPALASDFSLALPVDCTLGETCYIQQYMDRDPGPGAQDFTCGTLSYDGHRGTDFALPTRADMEAGVDVLAAASGTVLGRRDGVEDAPFTPDRAEEIAGRECGNGVVLDHGGGWVTQYCHLRRGSVTVAPGQRVEVGHRLGQIGMSGKTEFPHLHLSLRKDGADVDPFGQAPEDHCDLSPTGDTMLWAPPLPYAAGGILDIGFADAIPRFDDIQAGNADRAITPSSPAFVIFAFAFGSRAGDRMILTVTGPKGELIRHEVTLERTQAQLFRAAGRQMRSPWPAGTYEGIATMLRGDTVIDQARAVIQVE